jgi:PBP1b-binding outer membrane lipoprotein LpoB
MKLTSLFWILILSFILNSCGSFKSKRVSADESDEAAMEITDKWVDRDTVTVVRDILKQVEKHKGFQRYLRAKGERPKVFIAEVQNNTSNAYFPIDDLNDEMLTEFSSSGEFVLIDAAAREKLLKEITYQNDGMVDPTEAKQIGKQAGADLLIFGNVRMKPESRSGKTMKQYSVNIRMTDLERGIEVLRTRSKVYKISEQSGSGW